MVRIALAYLGIAVVAILMVTGLPFDLFKDDPAPQVASLPAEDADPVDAAQEAGPEQAIAQPAPETPVQDPIASGLAIADLAPADLATAEPAPAAADDSGLFSAILSAMSGSGDVQGKAGDAGALASDAMPEPPIETSIAQTTALILKELSAPAPQVDAALVDDTAATLSSTALATVQAARDAGSPREVTLETLLAQAMAAGQSAEQIDHLINEAVGQGTVRVPAMMVTTEGRVDTAVLIASILAQSQTATQEQGDTSTGDGYITPETAILDIQDMAYTVATGDSLGALSLKFYGTPAYFKAILAANRHLLATPSSIRAGQVLLIPARSKL